MNRSDAAIYIYTAKHRKTIVVIFQCVGYNMEPYNYISILGGNNYGS